MNAIPTSRTHEQCYALRFRSLFEAGRALVFPCDARGLVDLDQLSERALYNYLFARGTIGVQYGLPRVEPVDGEVAP